MLAGADPTLVVVSILAIYAISLAAALAAYRWSRANHELHNPVGGGLPLDAAGLVARVDQLEGRLTVLRSEWAGVLEQLEDQVSTIETRRKRLAAQESRAKEREPANQELALAPQEAPSRAEIVAAARQARRARRRA